MTSMTYAALDYKVCHTEQEMLLHWPARGVVCTNLTILCLLEVGFMSDVAQSLLIQNSPLNALLTDLSQQSKLTPDQHFMP